MSWAALLTILPYLFQIIGFILKRVDASNDVIAKFQAFVESTKNEGLISVAASDKFKDLHHQLMDQTGGSNEKTPPGPTNG